MTVHTEAIATEPRSTRWAAPGVCLLGTALAVAVAAVMGSGLGADDGAGVTGLLVESAGRWQGASILAVFGAAALCLAAVRLGRHVGGTAGTVATVSGAAVALLFAAYYASFAAGAAVASFVIDDAGAGLGEATLVVANMVELTRYAPSLVLLVVALTARRSFTKPVTISAGILVAMLVFPLTSWIAALLTPVWLGVAGSAARERG